jgi:hypothetical protein
MVSGTISLRSQRFFSPFPRGTCSLSVTSEYLALRSGLRGFMRSSTCIALLRVPLGSNEVFGYRSLTFFGALFHTLHLTCLVPHRGPTTPEVNFRFGLIRFRSPLLTESHSLSFPHLTEMFHFGWYGVIALILFGAIRNCMNSYRLSYSEIPGSKPMCGYPRLIAACHVLHRLLVPRHSLCALCFLHRFNLSLFDPLSRIGNQLDKRLFFQDPKVIGFLFVLLFELSSNVFKCLLLCMQFSKNKFPCSKDDRRV